MLHGIGKLDRVNMFSPRRLVIIFLCVSTTSVIATLIRPDPPDITIKAPSSGNDSAPLVNFQVHEPVFTPIGLKSGPSCVHTQTLMEHDFAFSYGHPFVGEYRARDVRPSFDK